MMKITVKGKGHGTGWNSYPFEFSFNMNGEQEDYEEDEIFQRIRREAKRFSACDAVTIEDYEID